MTGVQTCALPILASNKVGHFIYGLHDRVWPDFVCHFTLFRGVPPVSESVPADHSWHSSSIILAVSQRLPTALRPDLGFLKSSVVRDLSASTELKFFGFSRPAKVDVVQADQALPAINIGSLFRIQPLFPHRSSYRRLLRGFILGWCY